MGGSSSQVTGYKYYTNFLLFIGNPIEKVLCVNFDKRGWLRPLVDKYDNALDQGVVDSPDLYGENEGGVAGTVHGKYGTDHQEVLPFYKEYMQQKELPASAFPFQSYIAFEDFYVGNSGHMKDILLWPKRTRIRNDGRRQWYEIREDGAIVCEVGAYKKNISPEIPVIQPQTIQTTGSILYKKTGNKQIIDTSKIRFTGYVLDKPRFNPSETGNGVLIIISPDELDLSSYGAEVELRLYSSNLPPLKIKVVISYYGEASYEFGGVILNETLIRREKTETHGNTTFSEIIEYELLIDPKFTFDAKIIQESAFAKPPTGSQVSSSIYIEVIDFELNNDNKDIKAFDINPIHKIREILTDDTAMNKSELSVNDMNFKKAADRIWDEGLGISWSITEKSCIEAINELCYHIEAGIRVNRQTGLYEIVLFRDDLLDDLHTIEEKKIKNMQYEITNADEVINQVNVNFYDRENIKDSSFSISESGLIQTLGRVNAETVDFPYFMNMRNAEIVANWKLKQLSTGAYKGSFTTGLHEARKWNRYDLIELPWSKRWDETILVRIMSINLGGPTNNEVSIEFVEVVPSTGMMNTSIISDDQIDKPLLPLACQYEPFELPYYFAVMLLSQRQVDDELDYESNFGLVGVVAEQPQSNSLYAIMKTHDGSEGDEWSRAATIHYSETADIDQLVSKTATSFAVKDSSKIKEVKTGTLIKCGSDWIGTPGEWMVFDGMDPYTNLVLVKRGALDTPPQNWGVDAKLYFCGTDIAFDEAEYVSGEKVLVSALTTTPSGVLKQEGSIEIEMKARAIRPYPPANVKINNTYWPETHIITNNIVLKWSHRNRMQQTGGEIISWYDSDVTVESGVTYSYELISNNVVLESEDNIVSNTVTIDASVLIPNKAHTLKLWSVRDGFESYQYYEHSFFAESASLILTAATDGSKATGNTVPIANISVNVDESLKANMQFDGSSIKGRAEPDAIITIEIEE